MKNIKGFIFITENFIGGLKKKTIFGKGDEENPYLNIESNNLIPFTYLREVARAARKYDLEKNLHGYPEIANFRLNIAETEKEAREKFQQEPDLVVIQYLGKKCKRIIGDYVPGRDHITADPVGTPITDNDLMPFNTKNGRSAYERALYCAQESYRQSGGMGSGTNSPLAKFYLRTRDDSQELLKKEKKNLI